MFSTRSRSPRQFCFLPLDSPDLHVNFVSSLPILPISTSILLSLFRFLQRVAGLGENSEHRENNRFLPFQEFSAESSHLWYNVRRRRKRCVILEEIRIQASRKKRTRDNEAKTNRTRRQSERDGKEGVNQKTAVDGCLISHGGTETRRHGENASHNRTFLSPNW